MRDPIIPPMRSEGRRFWVDPDGTTVLGAFTRGYTFHDFVICPPESPSNTWSACDRRLVWAYPGALPRALDIIDQRLVTRPSPYRERERSRWMLEFRTAAGRLMAGVRR